MNPTSIPTPANLAELDELASRPTAGVLSALEIVDSDVVVIGAGGKMGFHLSRMLHRGLDQIGSRFKVLAISRFGAAGATTGFREQGIETLSIDLTEPGGVESLPDSSNVFYLAGIKFGASGSDNVLRKMNVELPARVAERYLASQSRIVALSTGCVYAFATPESGGSVESDPLDPPGDYAVSCLGREQAFVESGVRTSLIRLNYSVDLRYGVLVDIAQKVLAGEPVDVSTGFANVIWQGDANAHIIQALPHASTPPFVVNITGARILQVREVATIFGELFNQPVTFVGSENGTAWLNNAGKSHRLWGLPTIDEDQLIEWVADWLRAGGETLNKPTQFQVRDGKY